MKWNEIVSNRYISIIQIIVYYTYTLYVFKRSPTMSHMFTNKYNKRRWVEWNEVECWIWIGLLRITFVVRHNASSYGIHAGPNGI